MRLHKFREQEIPLWDEIRPKLKKLFEEFGITQCELQLPHCKRGTFLSFAHSKKRREWAVPEDVEQVILTCNSCHQFIEALGNKKVITMEEVVVKIIENRYNEIPSIWSKND